TVTAKTTTRASTEPHSCECGEFDSTDATRLCAWLQRSRTRVSAERLGLLQEDALSVVASTEPHSCECGEGARCSTKTSTCRLQRSRTRVSAERSRRMAQRNSARHRFN